MNADLVELLLSKLSPQERVAFAGLGRLADVDGGRSLIALFSEGVSTQRGLLSTT